VLKTKFIKSSIFDLTLSIPTWHLPLFELVTAHLQGILIPFAY